MKKTLAILMILMSVALFGMTSFAASYSNKSGSISGTLKTYDSYASATTSNSSGGNAYVYVKVKYISSSGEYLWSSKSETTGSSYASTSRTSPAGKVVGAESGHGASKNSINFNLP